MNEKENEKKEWTKVYTDGSCVGNGKRGAKAGCGVFFGDNDPRNLSIPLPFKAGYQPTNQRAEIYVI